MRPHTPDPHSPRRVRAVRGSGAHGEIRLKRAYEPPAEDDGVRVLVDRLWPRGLSKTQLAADLWLKDAAPSEQLRLWFGHDPARWKGFQAKYRAELAARPDILKQFGELQRRGRLTLVYSARDEIRNQAVVLREVLEKRGCGRPRHPCPSLRAPIKASTRKGASE